MTFAERIHLHPMLQLAVALIIGIIVGDVWGSGLPTVDWLIACVVVIAVTIIVGSRHNLVQSMLILLAVVLLGAWIMVLKDQHEKVALSLRPIDYKAVVVSEPTEHGKVVRCDLLLTTGPLSGRSVKASILKDTVEKRFLQLHVGDGIEAWSVMEKPRNFHSDSNFDYVRWMQIHGFVAQTFIYYANFRKTKVDLRQTSRLERVKLVAMEFRSRLLRQYQQMGITGQSYAVIAAMTLGEKSKLSTATKDRFSISGSSHLLALSGLHLGIIYGLLSMIFIRRRWLLIGQSIIILAIWSYVVMVGMSPSVIRSAIMLTIYAMVSLLNHDRMSVNTLALTAFVMLLVNPLCLWDVGFQLSFLSVLGLFVLFKPIYHLIGDRWLHASRLLKWIWSMMVVSLSAQVMTAPLVMYYFGRFSCYFLLTNLVAVPLATIILYLAFAMFVATPFPVIQKWVGYGLLKVAVCLNTALEYIVSLPGSSIEKISINRLQVILIYVIIICVYFLCLYMRKMYRSAMPTR